MDKKDKEKHILMELLALSAVEHLSVEDEQQLAQLLLQYPEYKKDDFAKTTALSQIGFYLMDDTANETLPSEIRNKNWNGSNGRVNEILKSVINNIPNINKENTIIYACGHPEMVSDVARNYSRNFNFIEERFWKAEEVFEY